MPLIPKMLPMMTIMISSILKLNGYFDGLMKLMMFLTTLQELTFPIKNHL